jgi:LDH2 family malate/lactate/ureidoglycolate dehydrogenase
MLRGERPGVDRPGNRSENALRRAWEVLRTSGSLWAASLLLDRVGASTLGLWPDRTVTSETLSRQVAGILRGWGMGEDYVSTTVRHLLYADLHGIDSHGCGMLRKYHRDLQAGRLNVAARVEVVVDGAATALVDGGGGLGHPAADAAMKLAMAKCREAGIAAVAVRNSGHFGAAGAYAAMAAEAGLLGLAMTNTSRPAVVPTFGLEAMLGTNPIAFAAPASPNRPFLLDMATSTAPVGKLMTAWRGGDSIPEGWALDEQGSPVTKPRLAAGLRRLTPLGSSRVMGSHKGYGLAAMVEVLSALLPGQDSAPERAGAGRVGHFFLALDPGRFRPEGAFEADLNVMLDNLRSTTPVDPAQPVMVAGDPEHAAREERNALGIPLSRCVVEDIRFVCRASHVPFLLDSPA